MKRSIAFLLLVITAVLFTACGSSNEIPTNFTATDYATIIAENRNASDNESYTIFTLEDGVFDATSGVSDALDSESIEQQAKLTLDMLGCSIEDIEKAAFSVSLMNIKSYGIAIIQPAPDKSDTITQALNIFIEAQKSSQENYLAEQYAIAKASKLTTLKSGQIVLVMCPNQDTVYNNIKNALK